MHKPQTRLPMWLLVAGVAVVGILIVATFANGGAGGLWLLLILACPLLMLFMMGSMSHNHMSQTDEQQDGMIEDAPNLAGLSRDEQVRALRRKLIQLAWQQGALRQDLERLEAEPLADAESRAGIN